MPAITVGISSAAQTVHLPRGRNPKQIIIVTDTSPFSSCVFTALGSGAMGSSTADRLHDPIFQR